MAGKADPGLGSALGLGLGAGRGSGLGSALGAGLGRGVESWRVASGNEVWDRGLGAVA